MKRKYVLYALSLTMLLLAGCTRQQNKMAYIGEEAAKKMAIERAGLTAASVDFASADLDRRNDLDYYHVGFTAGGQKYEYDVDALTGVIIESNSTADSSKENAGTDMTAANLVTDATEGSLVTRADTYNVGEVPSQPMSGSAADSSGNAGAGAKMITVEEAKDKALAHAGLTDDQVTFVKQKLDYEKGRQVYEVEFYTRDGKEYDYNIDAYTGEVINFDYEAEGYVPPTSGSTAITAEKAKEIALAQVPGATADNIWGFEVDYDDGRTEYGGKIVYSGMEYEFEIDGYSGAIRSWEVEPVNY